MQYLVLNAHLLSEYSDESLEAATTGIDMIVSYCHHIRCDQVHIIANTEFTFRKPKDSVVHTLPCATQRELITTLQTIFSGKIGTLIYSWYDYPFLSVELTRLLLHLHKEQYCEYTFADGYPDGMTPEVIELSTLSMLHSLSTDTLISRKPLFDIISKDINVFDVETEVSDFDYRMLRCHLSTHQKRDFQLCERLVHKGATNDTKLLALLRKERQLLRTLPSYAQIQITDTHPAPAYYEPKGLYVKDNTVHNWMALENFTQLLRNLVQFSPDIVIELGYRGEPALHPQWEEMFDVLRKEKMHIYVQSSGIGWQENHIESILEQSPDNIFFIFSIDAINPEVYQKIRLHSIEEALSTVERFLSVYPDQVYVQLTRLQDFEHEVDAFYHYWKEKTNNIIIQKHNNFCNAITSQKVVDLSPLNRFPCWQLERDITVLLDGTVPLCAQDYETKFVQGNVFKQSLQEVWEQGNTYFLDHVKGNYPPCCKQCDEYYIFHA